MYVNVFLKPLTEFVYKWFTVHSFYSFFQILDSAMFASFKRDKTNSIVVPVLPRRTTQAGAQKADLLQTLFVYKPHVTP